MHTKNSLSSLGSWATLGLAWSAASAGRCDARAVVRETGDVFWPVQADGDAAASRMGGRRLLDTSWQHPAATAPGASGLYARVYHLGASAAQASPPAFRDIANQTDYAARNPPSYAFVTTNVTASGQGIHLSGVDKTPTQTFLGALAAGAAATDAAPWASSIIDLHGYINFPTTGTYQFNLVSADDAATVYLGGNSTAGSGTLLQARNYDSSITTAPGLPNPLHIDIFPVDGVAQTGWYPIEVFLYNQYDHNLGGANLQWQVSGPAPVQFSAYRGAPRPPVPAPNPLHQYTFNSGDVTDSAPADQSNGTLLGGAVIRSGALSPARGSTTQAAQLGNMGFFTGSFSLGQWFTLSDHAPGFQVLFCFANDTQNYFVGHPQRRNDGLLSVEYAQQGNVTLLRAPMPPIGVPIKLFTTYEGTNQQIKLYVNDSLVDARTLPFAFNLAGIATKYKNIGGVSPWGDPSVSGTVDQVNVYREALAPQQISDTQVA